MRPCVGKWALFDSTKPDDHATAKAICGTCPDPCTWDLREAQRLAHSGGGPQGTWAGRLLTENPDHRIEYKRQYRAKKAAERKAAYEANPDRCADCDTALPYNATGGPRTRCKPCAHQADLARSRVQNRRRRERLKAAAARADWDRKKTA